MNTFVGKSAVVAALGALGVYATAGSASAAPSGLIKCEIQVTKSKGEVELTGIVHALMATSGSYRFKVTNDGDGGSANINQGGDFQLAAGESTVVGSTTLGNADALNVKLSVTSDHGSATCSR